MDCQPERSTCSQSDSLVWHHLDQLIFQENEHPTLNLKTDEDLTDVTANTRDSYAQVLRCLKVWYDVPPECLLLAVNAMDRFLSKMKVHPKYMACIAVSCFHLSLQITRKETKVINAADLLHISQAHCTVTDMLRMEQIIWKKVIADHHIITPLDFLLLFDAMYYFNNQPCSLPVPKINFEEMLLKLEVLICHYQCAKFKSSALALSLFYSVFEAQTVMEEAKARLLQLVTLLQELCQIPDGEMLLCNKVTTFVLSNYDLYKRSPVNLRQRLVWKLSRRTLLQLKPTARASSALPTIQEGDFLPSRQRFDSESDGLCGSDTSSESMETEDDDDCNDYCKMLEFWKISTNSSE